MKAAGGRRVRALRIDAPLLEGLLSGRVSVHGFPLDGIVSRVVFDPPSGEPQANGRGPVFYALVESAAFQPIPEHEIFPALELVESSGVALSAFHDELDELAADLERLGRGDPEFEQVELKLRRLAYRVSA